MDSMDSNLIALIFHKQIHQKCNDSQKMRHLFLPQHFSISACHGIYNHSKRLKLELQTPAWLVPLCGACLCIPKIFGSWVQNLVFLVADSDIWKSKVDTIIVQESYPAFKKRTSFVSAFLWKIRTLKRNLYIHLAEHFEARNVTFRNLMKFPPHSSFLFNFSQSDFNKNQDFQLP